MSDQTVLVVEDEAAIRDMLSFSLTSAGFNVIEAPNAERGWDLLIEKKPDCVLLDWMLPGVTGVALAKRIRQNTEIGHVPIIMLTARGEDDDQVQGFDAGADDYVVKPFSPKALIARIKAMLRRKMPDDGEKTQVSFENLSLDLTSHRFTVKDKEVKLGPTEFKLIHFFMTHPDRVYTRVQLLDFVWGESVVVEERTVDVHIRRLRKQLSSLDAEGFIQTVRGAGYRFGRPL